MRVLLRRVSRRSASLRRFAAHVAHITAIMYVEAHPDIPNSHRFFHHSHAVASLRYISGTKLDERIIRADLDPGYTENRQYGRGRSGGQVRDEYREDWDRTLAVPFSA